MLKAKKHTHAHSIVLVGDFNPKIFQPHWFSYYDLIGENEAEEAEINVVHPDIVSFKLKYFTVQVTRDRFFASTTNEAFHEILRDFVISTFKILMHTPLKMLGINNELHYRLTDKSQLEEFKGVLTPSKYWEGVLGNWDMENITIVEKKSYASGHFRLAIQESNRVDPGLFFNINDHFEVANGEKTMGSVEIIEMLSQHWQMSMDKAYNTVEKIWDLKDEFNK